ncbi:hypothetical protein DFP72DRAFT_407018 [Ephemerocybe angulata]|uniref:Uncharacterized protein n=1 Tax=Ephemerocybe angulata TaxID=980116 RepID=A0A8H6M619_9AGAR|nr:hypothetical protein DFP72DRAFT_407018 [Tulosesus angulatus]
MYVARRTCAHTQRCLCHRNPGHHSRFLSDAGRCGPWVHKKKQPTCPPCQRPIHCHCPLPPSLARLTKTHFTQLFFLLYHHHHHCRRRPILVAIVSEALNTPHAVAVQDVTASAINLPSPSETEHERAVRLASEGEAKRISEQIDDDLREEKERLKRRRSNVKILLLGQAESGKSTSSCTSPTRWTRSGR